MHEPVEGDGAHGVVDVEGMEEGDERLFLLPVGESRVVARHGQELVGVEEAKPFVLMTVPFVAVCVHGVLHRPRTFRAVDFMISESALLISLISLSCETRLGSRLFSQRVSRL